MPQKITNIPRFLPRFCQFRSLSIIQFCQFLAKLVFVDKRRLGGICYYWVTLSVHQNVGERVALILQQNTTNKNCSCDGYWIWIVCTQSGPPQTNQAVQGQVGQEQDSLEVLECIKPIEQQSDTNKDCSCDGYGSFARSPDPQTQSGSCLGTGESGGTAMY